VSRLHAMPNSKLKPVTAAKEVATVGFEALERYDRN
jgi:hypothetical protein